MRANNVVVSFLETVACFAVLDPDTLAAVASYCRIKSFQKDQILFNEGDLCRHLYILESGRVKCYRASAEGREQILRIVDRPRDVFCIPSVFSRDKHIVSASAMTETRLYVIDREAVTRMASEHPSVAMSVIGTAGEQMKNLVVLTENLSLKTATARLAELIYDLATHEAVPSGKKVRLPRSRLREEDIGLIIGTVRVHVSRSLKNLTRAGAIGLSRNFVEIRDLSILKRLSERDCSLG